jgi:GNAT superfamily N-acetyltransferase
MNSPDQIVVDFALPGDAPGLHALIKELAVFENAGDQVILTSEELNADVFGANPKCKVYAAKFESEIVGMALFYGKYSTWTGSCVYLEDLIVSENWRGKGIGTKLFLEVAKYAAQTNAGRLEWQVLDWNESGIAFYNKLGAVLDDSWVNCKLTRDQLSQLKRKNGL